MGLQSTFAAETDTGHRLPGFSKSALFDVCVCHARSFLVEVYRQFEHPGG